MPTTKTNEDGDDPHWAKKLLDGLNVFEINGNWHTRWHQGRYRMRPVYVGSTNKYTEDQALVRAQNKMVVKMGRWLCDQGRYDDAIMLYDAFLEKYPELPYFWEIKGQALEKSSRHSEAEAAFKKAEELQKQLAEKHLQTSDKKIVKKVGPLIQDLKDRDSAVRSEAAWILGEKQSKRAIYPLIEALKDEDTKVRFAAAWALGFIGDPKAVDPLIEALKDEDGTVRERAASGLRIIGDPKAVDPLIEALKDEDGTVRERAADSLGSIGDPKAVDPLIEALKDEDGTVRSSKLSKMRTGLSGNAPPIASVVSVIQRRLIRSLMLSSIRIRLGMLLLLPWLLSVIIGRSIL